MINITLIFDSEIATCPLYPVSIDAAEEEAGYQAITFTNENGHYMGALPYCRGVGRELENDQVRVKVQTPEGHVLYSTKDRNTWHPIGSPDATP